MIPEQSEMGFVFPQEKEPLGVDVVNEMATPFSWMPRHRG
jgi:hypothetical protein